MAIDPTIRSRPAPARAALCLAMALCLAAASCLAAATARAQTAGPAPAQPPATQAAAGSDAEASFGGDADVARQQIADVLRRTTAALSAPVTGDVDKDLADKVIAFHQSSIDLAQIVLQLGADPELRRLAVLSVQVESRAVAEIRTWLSNRELARQQINTPPAAQRLSAPTGGTKK